MSDDNDLDAARAELAALESEAADLKKQIDDLEAQLQKLRQRYGKIIPTGWVDDLGTGRPSAAARTVLVRNKTKRREM